MVSNGLSVRLARTEMEITLRRPLSRYTPVPPALIFTFFYCQRIPRSAAEIGQRAVERRWFLAKNSRTADNSFRPCTAWQITANHFLISLRPLCMPATISRRDPRSIICCRQSRPTMARGVADKIPKRRVSREVTGSRSKQNVNKNRIRINVCMARLASEISFSPLPPWSLASLRAN